MDTIKISGCCRDDVKTELQFGELIYVCWGCGNECEVLDVCADCLGTGEVVEMERVYPEPGSPLAPIGLRKCHCQTKQIEYDNQQ